jgi:regulator of protease activity HflC (stomatin/prohibitin superfamily)
MMVPITSRTTGERARPTQGAGRPSSGLQAGIQALVWIVIFLIGAGVTYHLGKGPVAYREAPVAAIAVGIVTILVASFAAASIRIAAEWERIAVLTLGKFAGMRGPGFFIVVPIFQATPFVVDLRIITYDVPMQKSLTKDNIPVTVDAIVYYKVDDPNAAVLKVEAYHAATQLGAQTVLRDQIGKATLDELLSEREKLGEIIRTTLDQMTDRWGVKIPNVELKEVIISEKLEDAIAREPAAEREKRARLKLAEAEKLAAQTIYEAAQTYEKDPIALQLRSMNMLYEMCMEGKSTVIFVPTESHLGMPTPLGVYGLTDLMPKGGVLPKAEGTEQA